MANETAMIPVTFTANMQYAEAPAVHQYDYGRQLQVFGLASQQIQSVYFANCERGQGLPVVITSGTNGDI